MEMHGMTRRKQSSLVWFKVQHNDGLGCTQIFSDLGGVLGHSRKAFEYCRAVVHHAL